MSPKALTYVILAQAGLSIPDQAGARINSDDLSPLDDTRRREYLLEIDA